MKVMVNCNDEGDVISIVRGRPPQLHVVGQRSGAVESDCKNTPPISAA